MQNQGVKRKNEGLEVSLLGRAGAAALVVCNVQLLLPGLVLQSGRSGLAHVHGTAAPRRRH